MLQNYFKIAWRNLMKNKVFSAINMVGLSVGLTCCILIAAFVLDELSYDRYPAQAGQIYRVGLGLIGNGNGTNFPNVDVAVGQGIQDAFPEVEASTRLLRWQQEFVRFGEKQLKEKSVAVVDPNFMNIFSIPFLEGDAKTALKEPGSVVLTKELASRFFGDKPALGQTLLFGNGETTRKVTGVIAGIPANSHFHFNLFLSTTDFKFTRIPNWSNVGTFTYLVLKKGTDPQKLEAKFPQLVAEHVVPEIQRDMGISLAEAQKSVDTFKFTLQPLTDIHLHSATKYELEANGNISYVYIFSVLAFFILLLAIVNFTNLSTAGAAKRSKEIGIRKVMGSIKGQLMVQFLTESVVITFLSLVLSIGFVAILLPYFNELAGKQIDLQTLFNLKTVGGFLVFGILVGILAGIYPAFFLAFSKITTVLKGGSVLQASGRGGLRSGLVVFQFAISGALIIATLVSYQQLKFMQNKTQGFDKEQVLVIHDTYTLGPNEAVFKDQLRQDSRVVQATLSKSIPLGNEGMEGTEIFGKDPGKKGSTASIQTAIFRVDDQYLPTLGIHLRQGRNFSRAFSTDSAAVIINDAVVRELGWGRSNPIGKTIVRSGRREFTVIGVVKDFHFASARQKIAPLMLLLGNNSGAIQVKVKTGDVSGAVAAFRQKWEAFNPSAPFTYTFLDDRFAALYEAEQKTGQLFTVFAGISIVIACLGLFGLVTFTAEQRTKEIGVRKVMGATSSSIVVLLSKDFLKLVLISVLIAFPIAGWTMNLWLEDFAYRIEIAWWVYVLAAFLAVGIALLTVSFQSIKASLMNPVKSLRSE
ncbi:ABC transporter permease [Larkinella terrae]|uniref:FtsX-like permease family protein n=1 Tax=Larkinella terrae TaxID=2025311 RepID=A0A7K0ERZ0_9BACT|nr:ABC transporter permease [Larkinella terrae]MRS64208.1 FtsX-like permease family protein [Larkinella terrae]